ncbi:hypothetical protein AVEN_29248-1 [Araneus ventricosus]|uniref:Uncharacterized protein n=1 Tax=Araneus ventricosus TaxID=182803 RepID=A0A4Y2E1S3_ARAVE|nr:hypothetical protein AVEN_29248-1 [Araneus ventricosus]
MSEENAGSTSSEAERVKMPVRFSDQVVYFRRTPSPDENDRRWSETLIEPSTSDDNYNGDVDNPVQSFLSDSR